MAHLASCGKASPLSVCLSVLHSKVPLVLFPNLGSIHPMMFISITIKQKTRIYLF